MEWGFEWCLGLVAPQRPCAVRRQAVKRGRPGGHHGGGSWAETKRETDVVKAFAKHGLNDTRNGETTKLPPNQHQPTRLWCFRSAGRTTQGKGAAQQNAEPKDQKKKNDLDAKVPRTFLDDVLDVF